MFISRIFIKNFRNFRQLDISLDDGVTCFIGENNIGKTNLFHALRLVLDSGLSGFRRKLRPEDFASGLSIDAPEQVIVAVEFSDFANKPNEQALLFNALMPGQQRARLTFRFRPRAPIREMRQNMVGPLRRLKIDDYGYELAGGGDADLSQVQWHENFGRSFFNDDFQQGFHVVSMEALRDVESRLASPRTSPLQQIIDQCEIPSAERAGLVRLLQTANDGINASHTVGALAGELSTSFREAAGRTYGMQVGLGLGEASFDEISHGLKVLLSGYGLTNLNPSRNGLGLNNVLYISMLLNFVARRIGSPSACGQLLLVEEPEAHLHPQLQRVLLETLQRKQVQVFVSTHSTHITSGVPLKAHVVLTRDGEAVTQGVRPAGIPNMQVDDIADLDRYLDATRSALLYARKVLLVEGPAELFMVPALAKQVMGVNLDEEGIAVVPIFGTHFAAYAKLFGAQGIAKKCAILTDGDREVAPAPGGEDATPAFDRQPLDNLVGNYVDIFECVTTFEKEIVLPGNLEMLQLATAELGAPIVSASIQAARAQVAGGAVVDLAALRARVLSTAKRFGKARFAQVASKHCSTATELPDYLRRALDWLCL